MGSNIKMVVFDMAGTTVSDNEDVAKAFQKGFDSVGVITHVDMIQPLMGYHKPVAIRMLMQAMGLGIDERQVDVIHQEFKKVMAEFYKTDPSVRPMPGAEPLFHWLGEQGIVVALNTGFSKEIASIIMDRFQWKEKGLVHHLIGSDEVELGRPHAFMIQRLMGMAGVADASTVVKVGDTAVDMEEGRNAGCGYLIGVTTGAYSEEELEKVHPTHIIDHLSEIPAIITRHGI